MRFAIAAAVALFLAQDVHFGEKIDVHLVEVDAVVTDRQGNRVYGLTADDFEIYEGRTQQKITNFTEYRAETPASGAANGAPSAAPVPARPREPHSMIVLLDSLPQKDFVRQKMFQQIEELLAKTVAPGDQVSVVLWDGGHEHVRTIVDSSDKDRILSAVRDFGSRMESDTGEDPHRQTDLEAAAYAKHPEIAARDKIDGFGGQTTISAQFGAENALMVLHRKAAAIARLIGTLGSRPGRKTLLYVSHNFKMEGEPDKIAAKRYIDEIAASANANGVVFYAARPFMPDDMPDASDSSEKFVDADDWMLNGGALQRVTDATGGLLEYARSSVGTLAPRVAEDLESYYSIAYRVESNGRDRVRTVNVRTKNPEYRVRTRTAVIEKSPETQAKEAVVRRLFVDEGPADVQFEVHEGPVKRTSGNRWLLPILVKIPAGQLQFAEERGRQVAHAGVLIASASDIAEVTPVSESELRIVNPQDLDKGFVTWSAEILGDKRGSKVSIGVVDRRTGAVGVRTIDNRNRFH